MHWLAAGRTSRITSKCTAYFSTDRRADCSKLIQDRIPNQARTQLMVKMCRGQSGLAVTVITQSFVAWVEKTSELQSGVIAIIWTDCMTFV
jgi:hypothetical protein